MTQPLRYTLRDTYGLYKRMSAQNQVEYVDNKTYLAIVYLFMKFIIKKVWDGYFVTLPMRMGIFHMIGRRKIPKVNEETGEIENLNIDWKATKDLWAECEDCRLKKQKVYHMNEHTNNISYVFSWSKKEILVENKDLYNFQLSRTNKRNTAKILKGGKEYLVK